MDKAAKITPYTCDSAARLSSALAVAVRVRVAEIGARRANVIMRRKLRGMAGKELRRVVAGDFKDIGPKRLLATCEALNIEVSFSTKLLPLMVEPTKAEIAAVKKIVAEQPAHLRTVMIEALKEKT